MNFEKVMKEADEFIKVLKSFQSTRTTVISKDDIVNLTISLNTTNSVEEFLESC